MAPTLPMPDTAMRLLLAADLHYSLPQLDWIVEAAARFDVVVLAGDHLDISSAVPLDAQSTVIARYVELLRARTKLVVSSGNHDLTGPDANGEQSALWVPALRADGVLVDGDTAEVGDALVTVCPWWDGDAGRAAVEAQFERDAARARRPWVWVYHWPPIDSPTSWTGRRFYGDPDLRGWIERFGPDVVLTGHVHESPFKDAGGWADRIGDTWVFNAGRQIGPVPVRVEIDLDEREAVWVSMLGVEGQPLDDAAPAARTVI